MLCHYWKVQTQESAGASGLKAFSVCVGGGGGRGGGEGGGVKSQPDGAYNEVFDFVGPRPKESVLQIF